jgi:hypothetical protein
MCGSRRAAAGRSPRAREDRWTYGGEPARDVVFFQNKPTTMRHNTDMFGAASIHTLEQQSERCVWCPALRWAYPVGHRLGSASLQDPIIISENMTFQTNDTAFTKTPLR